MNKQDTINEIFSNFYFSKVQTIMTSLNWTWLTDDGMKQPTIQQMEDSAEELISYVWDKLDTEKDSCISTGGFMVRGSLDDQGFKYINMFFVLEEWNNEFLAPDKSMVDTEDEIPDPYTRAMKGI